jgi:hypothetical protein
MRNAAALILSASGKNRDALVTLQHCIRCDVRAVGTISTQHSSRLASDAMRFDRAFVFAQEGPAKKDGFLATNSLLAMCVFVARAYGATLPEYALFGPPPELPNVQGRFVVQVLHGGWASPVATDLESKLNESAIASAQVSDYRNFGHGRHLWLARRPSETLIVEAITPRTARIAERTRALLPSEIPVLQLRTAHEGSSGTIDLLIQGFHLVEMLGRLQGFDPGRPSVPEFGRKLYALRANVVNDDHPAAVTRKVQSIGLAIGQNERVRSAFEQFASRLQSTKIGGIVMDYDGTLCSLSERFDPLRPQLADECRRLLLGGLTLGIATGRGRSVRQSLQAAIPQNLWERVVVGYYNGGQIASLACSNTPSRGESAEPPLDIAQTLLSQDQLLNDVASCTIRSRQITIDLRRAVSLDAIFRHVMTLLAPLEEEGVRILKSSHSIDVLPPGVGKLAVVRDVKMRIKENTEVLCIGDRGAWPGNDCSLLSHEPSLSVDEVSTSVTTCWNLAPPGMSGVDATLQYLRSIHVSEGSATIDVTGLWGRS